MSTPRPPVTGKVRHRRCWILLSDGTSVPVGGRSIVIPGQGCIVTDDPALLTPFPDGTHVQGRGAVAGADVAGPTGWDATTDNATGGGRHPARAGPHRAGEG